MAALKRFVDYVKSHDKVWLTRRIDIAKHWRETHPYEAPAQRPLDESFAVHAVHTLTPSPATNPGSSECIVCPPVLPAFLNKATADKDLGQK